jgi:hypothetical protein
MDLAELLTRMKVGPATGSKPLTPDERKELESELVGSNVEFAGLPPVRRVFVD